jgi:hypothetical protein
MTVKEKIEGYLIKLELNFEVIGDNTWLVRENGAGLSQVVVYAEDALVILRVKVLKVPDKNKAQLFEDLLRLNAADIVHGAYAIEGDNIILIETLEYKTLDLEELQAAIDAIGMALAQHYPLLAKYMTV